MRALGHRLLVDSRRAGVVVAIVGPAFVVLGFARAGRTDAEAPLPPPVIEQVTSTEADIGQSGVAGLRAKYVLEGTRDDTWAVLANVGEYARLFDGVDKSEVVEKGPDWAIVKMIETAGPFEFAYSMRCTFDVPNTKVTIREVEGVDLMRGHYLVRPHKEPRWVEVEYLTFVDMGWYMPTSLVLAQFKGVMAGFGKNLQDAVADRARARERGTGDP